MSDSLILTKAKAFAIRVVKLHKYLRGKREATMSKQILRCGTSIGANLAEAKYAQSKDDFISKQAIALKEAGETLYCRTHSERLSHAQVFDHARDAVISELNQADMLCENDPRHYARSQSLKILKELCDARRNVNT